MLIKENIVIERANISPTDPYRLVGVKLLGRKSGNNRQYPRAVQEGAIPLAQGMGVYEDHADAKDKRRSLKDNRLWKERLAHVIDGTVAFDPVSECLRGDLKLRRAHPMAEMFKADYEDGVPNVGISIVADADFPGGVPVGECLKIKRIYGFDVVDRPGTVHSLTEQEENEPAAEAEEPEKLVADHEAMLKKHEEMIAEHAAMLEKHKAHLEKHDGLHREHEDGLKEQGGKIEDMESALAKASEGDEGKKPEEAAEGGGEVHAKEQLQANKKELDQLQSRMSALVSEQERLLKSVPRQPTLANPINNGALFNQPKQSAPAASHQDALLIPFH